MSVKPVAWRAQYGKSGVYSQPTDDRTELSEDFTAEEIEPLYSAPAIERLLGIVSGVEKLAQEMRDDAEPHTRGYWTAKLKALLDREKGT